MDRLPTTRIDWGAPARRRLRRLDALRTPGGVGGERASAACHPFRSSEAKMEL